MKKIIFALSVICSLSGFANATVHRFKCVSYNASGLPIGRTRVAINASKPSVLHLLNGGKIRVAAKVVNSFTNEQGDKHQIINLTYEYIDSTGKVHGQGTIAGEFERGATGFSETGADGDVDTFCSAGHLPMIVETMIH